jgi:hypothetical protein
MKQNIDVLILLDSYIQYNSKANANLKSAIWNINKARRQKDALGVGQSYSASDVREEIRAHVRLDCDEEPQLEVEESMNEKEEERKNNVRTMETPFKLKYVEKIDKKQQLPETDEEVLKTIHDNSGIRRRKGKESEEETSKSVWIQETCIDAEEEKLHNMDPIELFGALPPKDLKLAQKQAKEMLEAYVNAANKAVEILKILNAK